MEKRADLVVLPLFLWSLLGYFVVWPWMRMVDRAEPWLSGLAHLNAGIWWVVLLWGLHHLTFQLGALLQGPPRGRGRVNPPQEPQIAILYTTCDDFDEAACLSCVEQEYRALEIYVCDDSAEAGYRDRIDRFAGGHPTCRIVRRGSRSGFKAGNLNHAIENAVGPAVEWVLVVDADQRLPRDYVSRLSHELPPPGRPDVAFVQASHSAPAGADGSVFQRVLGPEVRLFYQRDLGLRERYGFVPLLGHGAVIRKSAWADLGGFPELVSEDFAWALRAAREGKRGRYAASVESYEAYPHDLGAFLTRLRKFSGGSAELMRRELGRFFVSGVSWVERWDFAMAMLWYLLMPLLLANGFLSAYVVHGLWDARQPYLHPALPYLYTWLLISLLGLCRSVTHRWDAALRFYFWSSAVYSAVLPICAWAVVKHFFVPPRFTRTPKGGERVGVPRPHLLATTVVGAAALAVAVTFWSPFSPILLGQGVAYLCLGLFVRLSSRSPWGAAARIAVYLPGALYLLGLYSVWAYAHS